MKLSKSLLSLAACALAFGFTACDDDSDSSSGKGGNNSAICTLGEYRCDGKVLQLCANDNDNNGTLGWQTNLTCTETQTCNATAQKCDDSSTQSGGNGGNEQGGNGGNEQGDTAACTAGTFKCVGDLTIMECKENGSGTLELQLKERCSTGVCDATSGECKKECEDDEVSCDGAKPQTCENGRWKAGDACGVGFVCEKTTGTCVKDQAAAEVAPTVIGSACHCNSSCDITISGKEIKDALGSATMKLLGLAKITGFDIDTLDDKDQIVAPNYFSNDITGCENLTAPAGMAVGCFETRTITLPDSLIALIKKVPSIMGFIPENALAALGDVDVTKIMNGIIPVLEKGIEFKSEGGYCILSTINIDLNVTDGTINTFIDMDNVNKLVNKIKVGDASKVDIQTSCPDGSEMIAFNAGDESGKGSAQVAFDVCLKTCKTDDDCKTDANDNRGLECIQIEDDYKVHSVCFEKDNIDYFTQMTKDFGLGGEEN